MPFASIVNTRCKMMLIIGFFSIPCSAQFNFYKFSSQIDSIFQADTDPNKGDMAATSYSFIGEHKKALLYFSQARFGNRTKPSEEQELKMFNQTTQMMAKYTIMPAQDYILREAQKTRVVIINEAHHIPQHRKYMETLLPALKKIGYNIIGMEALEFRDSLYARTYPTINDGFYTSEPSFGNLIRKALSIGIKPFSYDPAGKVDGKEREIAAAANIKKVIDQFPNEKFIIFCGYSHALEDSLFNQWELAMAGRLKQLTGIDPLTIDQVELTETGMPHFDNRIRQITNLKQPGIYVDEKGKAFGRAANNKTYDANIYHPSTRWINGRPDWLQSSDRKPIAINDRITIKFPCLVFAYNSSEDTKFAVPVDVIELFNKNDKKSLILKKGGTFTVIVKNVKGHTQKFQVRS